MHLLSVKTIECQNKEGLRAPCLELGWLGTFVGGVSVGLRTFEGGDDALGW